MKRSTLAIFGACAMATVSTAVFSPAMAFADAAPSTTQPGEKSSEKHEHPLIERLKAAVAQLDLTADQKTKIDGLVATAIDKLRSIRESMKGQDRAAIRDASKPVIKDLHDQVKAVLTPEQLKKLHDLMAEAEKHGPKPTTGKSSS